MADPSTAASAPPPRRCSPGPAGSSPAGSTRPVRSFRSVGGHPYFVARGEGAYVWDADGNRLLDFVQSYGASILGHAHPAVVAAVREAAGRGTTFGAPTEGEVLLAEAITRPGARMRAGPTGVVGHRGGHERDPGGPRVHGPGPNRQVRRLLPRALRRAPGRRGQRGGHPRAARLGRRAGRRGGRHRGRPLQRGARARRPGGVRDRRGGGRQHGTGPAGAGLPRGSAGSLRRGQAHCWSSTR